MTTVRNPELHGIGVRPARRADLVSVYRIETAAFPQPWPFAAFEQFLGDPGFIVAATDGAVIGYAVANTVPTLHEQVGHLKNLAVHEDHRGRGVGSLLLSRTLAGLEATGVETVNLEVRPSNESALALYRSHGFERRSTVEGYYDDGEDALVLVRDQ